MIINTDKSLSAYRTAAAQDVIDGKMAKTFSVASSSDLASVSAAIAYHQAGGLPVLLYDGHFYYLDRADAAEYVWVENYARNMHSAGYSRYAARALDVTVSGATATAITYYANYNSVWYLSTDTSYSGYFTPTNDGHPATKKYVDDRAVPNYAAASSGDVLSIVGGVPAWAAMSGSVQIATGSYVGTGTYGSSNPNSLTFDFAPKLVFISAAAQDTTSKACGVTTFVSGAASVTLPTNSSSYIMPAGKATWSGNSLSWFCTNAHIGGSTSSVPNAFSQLNKSNVTYSYIAIG